MNPFEPPRSSSPRFMDATLTSVTCPACKASYGAGSEKTFLGFRKATCPECRFAFKRPLSMRRRVLYWSLLALAAGLWATSDLHTRARPGIFLVLMGVAVAIDLVMLLRRR